MEHELEGDAARFIGAMRCTRDMLAGRSPGLPIAGDDLAHLMDVLLSEAARIVPATRLLPHGSND